MKHISSLADSPNRTALVVVLTYVQVNRKPWPIGTESGGVNSMSGGLSQLGLSYRFMPGSVALDESWTLASTPSRCVCVVNPNTLRPSVMLRQVGPTEWR